MSTGLTGKAKSELTHEELEKLEKEEFEHGPLNILTASVKNNTQVLINCRLFLVITSIICFFLVLLVSRPLYL